MTYVPIGGAGYCTYIPVVCVCLFYVGTYNNQYMVLDLKKIELQKAVKDGALWVVEQIPG